MEWMPDHNLFEQITKHLGLPVANLFASRVNHQIPEFVSWRPEPEAIATDAFNTPWDFPLTYLFPPFYLIPMCLRKVMQEQVDCILIAPVWRSWPWYPALLSILIECPLLLPQGRRILKLPRTDKDSSPSLPEEIPVSSMENFRKSLQNKGFPEKVSKILLSSWRSNTAKQYESAWKGGVAGVVKKG